MLTANSSDNTSSFNRTGSSNYLTARPCAVASACVMVIASGCGGDHRDSNHPPPPPASTTVAVVDGARYAPQLTGTWRVLGQGRYLAFGAEGLRQYFETASDCYATADTVDPAELAGATATGQLTQPGGQVELFSVPGTPVEMRLQRVDALPARCTAAAPSGAVATARVLCETLQERYPFFSERRIDWAGRCAALQAAAAQRPSEAALETALIEALDGFDDEHVSLHHVERGQLLWAAAAPTTVLLKQAFGAQDEVGDFDDFYTAWLARNQQAAAARLTERHEALGGAVVWGRLPGNIGYLSITRMAGYEEGAGPAREMQLAGEEMDRVVAALADTRAMIVDVALNQGGLDLVSGVLASRFADRRRLAFVTTMKQPEGSPARDWHIEPGGPRQYLKPIYLFTSEQTISAGETFVLMMRTLPHVRQAGQNTAGALSDVMGKLLPGPYVVGFPYQINRDPNGVLFEGPGIVPHLPITVFDPADPAMLESGHRKALSALLARIGN
ncbi:S41 family peptidase [Massilia sp. METH4]|uniref:S41 family peptidase n=1 Tax=Massilia sp. METH4 TaxID=3123041 RepID=UPI0030CFB903